MVSSKKNAMNISDHLTSDGLIKKKKTTKKKKTVAVTTSDFSDILTTSSRPYTISDLLRGGTSDLNSFLNNKASTLIQDIGNIFNKNSSDKMDAAINPLWQALKSSIYLPMMVIGLICSFTVSAVFYWAGRLMMKIKFEDMFKEKLPRHQSLVYSMGEIHNLDIDRVLLRDDLNDQHFTSHAVDGSIVLDTDRILQENRIMQSLTDQRTLSPEEVLSKGDLDNSVFEFQAQTGHVTVDVNKLIAENQLVQSTGGIQALNVDNVLMRDDLSPHMLATACGKLENLSLIDDSFADGVIIFDSAAPKKYERLLKRRSTLCLNKPLVIEVHEDCDVKVLANFIKHFQGNIILDISNYHLDPSVFDQFSLPVMKAATMES